MSDKKDLNIAFAAGLLSPLLVGALIVAMTPLIILRAWVLTVIWGWYAVPIYGVAPLSLVLVFGALVAMNIVLARSGKPKGEGFWRGVMEHAVTSLLGLVVAWMGSFFV